MSWPHDKLKKVLCIHGNSTWFSDESAHHVLAVKEAVDICDEIILSL
jgi:hypothetical protein